MAAITAPVILAPHSSWLPSAGVEWEPPWASVYLDVLAPVLQQCMLPSFHPAEELVHLGEVGYPILIQQVLEP